MLTPKHPEQGQHSTISPGNKKNSRGEMTTQRQLPRCTQSNAGAARTLLSTAVSDSSCHHQWEQHQRSPADQGAQDQAVLSLPHFSISFFPSSSFSVTEIPVLVWKPLCLGVSPGASQPSKENNSTEFSLFPFSTPCHADTKSLRQRSSAEDPSLVSH